VALALALSMRNRPLCGAGEVVTEVIGEPLLRLTPGETLEDAEVTLAKSRVHGDAVARLGHDERRRVVGTNEVAAVKRREGFTRTSSWPCMRPSRFQSVSP
jgi:hypothetical protein